MYKGPGRKFKQRRIGGRRRLSQFGIQLIEKQKLRALYGIRERKMKNYFLEAMRVKQDSETKLLQLLELRLDNVVYRAGFAQTRRQARQFVNHGHILVNGRRVNIPSYGVRRDDVVAVRPQSLQKGNYKDLSVTLPKHQAPPWLQVKPEAASVTILEAPRREYIQEPVDPAFVIEFYSR